MAKTYVSWKTIAPIIGDVVISPWNLLIGGLLISKLSFPTALFSILIGYSILGLIFYFYGNLGFIYRKKTSELIEPVFGALGTKYFFSLLLAVGQVGWFALITQIGGEALAHIFGIEAFIGIIIFAFAMFVMASLSLYKMGLVKLAITLSSISLILYLIAVNYHDIELDGLLNEKGDTQSLLWGVGVVVSSLISFATVTPDFFSQLNTRKDSILTVLTGLIIPGVIASTIGAILFHANLEELSFEVIMGTSSLVIFGHIFNVITNTDASIAIFTPGNRLEYILKIPFKVAVAIATVIGTILALTDFASYLEDWLIFLAGFYPSVIIITFLYYRLQENKIKPFYLARIAIVLISASLIFLTDSSYLIWLVAVTTSILYLIIGFIFHPTRK